MRLYTNLITAYPLVSSVNSPSERKDWTSSSNSYGDQFRYSAVTHHQMPDFHHAEQRRTLLLKGFLRWMLTFTIGTGIIGTLYTFERLHVMNDTHKRVFNTLITGLSLAWGLNISVGFEYYNN